MKLYVSRGMTIVPHEWLTRDRTIGQAYLVAVAQTKNHLDAMLQKAGAHYSVVRDLRMAVPPHSLPVKALVTARLVTFEEPGLWAYEAYQSGGVVVSIDGRQVKPAARWVRGPGTTITAEPVAWEG
jgi:hypothetical protein